MATTGWREIQLENASDHAATLASEPCRVCGVVLAAHYDRRGQWRLCRDSDVAVAERRACDCTRKAPLRSGYYRGVHEVCQRCGGEIRS
jgi:hypothetical protein